MICAIVSTGEETEFNKTDIEKLKNRISAFVFKLQDEGVTDFYINCERYVPMWAGAVAVQIGLKVHIVVPYEEQCVDWSEKDRNYYYHLHQRADTVTFSSKQYYDGCFASADRIMVENSDMVIVFGDVHPISVIAKEKVVFVPFF